MRQRQRNTIPRQIMRLRTAMRLPIRSKRVNIHKYKCCCCNKPLRKGERHSYDDMYDMKTHEFRKERIFQDADGVCSNCFSEDFDELRRFVMDADYDKIWKDMRYERYREGIPREERFSMRKRLLND